MLDRRRLITGAGALTLAGALPRPVTAATGWRPYDKAMVIDGAGGFGRPPGTPDGSLTPVDVQDVLDSGLTAVVRTVAPSGAFRFGAAGFEVTVKVIALNEREVDRYPHALMRIRSAADLDRARREKKVGVIYTFQETSPIGEDLERIDLFHGLGVRVIQLTHNKRNLVGDGCMEPGNAGLSAFGHAVVERLNDRRIVVDLAHGGQRTTAEAIRASRAPVLISHTGCRALADLPRNTHDAELKAMADKGGVAGMIFWPYLRKQGQPMAEDLIRHIEHAVKVCGEDHVGLGTDATVSAVERTPQWEKENREYIGYMIEDGVFEKDRDPNLVLFIPDLNHVRRFETLAGMLSSRGHSDARIEKILGGNFARVMREVWG